MKRMCGAALTPFFALLSPIFLAILFALLESARMQGVKVKAANAAYLANFSVFGEYEQKLLEDYEIFGVDVSGGTGDFSLARVRDRLDEYLTENCSPGKSIVKGLCFDPWQVSLSGSEITGYTLLTDQGCESFYQQAVAFMRETSVTGSISRLLDWNREAQEAKEKQDQYQKQQDSSDQAMETLEQKEEQLKDEGVSDEDGSEETPAFRNPLPALKQLRRQSLLNIACGASLVSDASVRRGELASGRGKNTGNLPVVVKYGTLTDHLLFREYLISRYSCYPGPGEAAGQHPLRYELEYLLSGRTSDRANLNAVVKSLLLLREGYNYAWCVSDPSMNLNAQTIAFGFAGWTGIPALVSIMKHALLLGLSYGESLLDLRILMTGGKVPLIKSANSWVLTLYNLPDILLLLPAVEGRKQEGYSYRDYLRLLLNLQPVSGQKIRGLDLAELNIRRCPGLSCFRADHCMVAMLDETGWKAAPLFTKAVSAFLGTGKKTVRFSVRSGFSYDKADS